MSLSASSKCANRNLYPNPNINRNLPKFSQLLFLFITKFHKKYTHDFLRYPVPKGTNWQNMIKTVGLPATTTGFQSWIHYFKLGLIIDL